MIKPCRLQVKAYAIAKNKRTGTNEGCAFVKGKAEKYLPTSSCILAAPATTPNSAIKMKQVATYLLIERSHDCHLPLSDIMRP